MNRDEIECYCQKHLPAKNVTVFTVTKLFLGDDDKPWDDVPLGWQMGIRYLKPIPGHYDEEDICPNIASDVKWENR
jgi:hypothetical protein